tara:strand:+ start:123 stop:311 length:189 start_codon:yes stop_codon:yes gene_type:complete
MATTAGMVGMAVMGTTAVTVLLAHKARLGLRQVVAPLPLVRWARLVVPLEQECQEQAVGLEM